MTRAALGLILLSVTITACAQLVLKAGMSGISVQRAIVAGPGLRMVMAIAFDPFVIGGLALYLLSTSIWLVVLSKVEVSLAYPFVALGHRADDGVRPPRLRRGAFAHTYRGAVGEKLIA